MTRDRCRRKAGAFAVLGLGAAFGCMNPLLSQTLSVYTYSDQQLMDAGWTKPQIVEMRAQAPEPEIIINPEIEEIEKTPDSVIGYTSVFDEYVVFDYLPEIGWRDANDTVGEIGGWRSYAQLVQEAQKKEAMASKEGVNK